MRVVYVSHTSIVSGAEQALLELLRESRNEVEIIVLCPEGELADTLRSESFEVHNLRGTSASLRVRMGAFPGAVRDLAQCAIQIRRTFRTQHCDLIHANSSRAGLMAILARLGKGP